jgi:hypothetical protein
VPEESRHRRAQRGDIFAKLLTANRTHVRMLRRPTDKTDRIETTGTKVPQVISVFSRVALGGG